MTLVLNMYLTIFQGFWDTSITALWTYTHGSKEKRGEAGMSMR